MRGAIFMNTQKEMEKRLTQLIADIKADKVKIDFGKMIYCEETGTEFPKFIEENNLVYALDEITFIYLPLLEVDEEPYPDYEMGMWGKRRLEYIKAEKKGLYSNLMIKGLWEHLVETDKSANEMEDMLMEQISAIEGVTEQLKQKNAMEWLVRRNNIKNRVREIVYNELIYI